MKAYFSLSINGYRFDKSIPLRSAARELCSSILTSTKLLVHATAQ